MKSTDDKKFALDCILQHLEGKPVIDSWSSSRSIKANDIIRKYDTPNPHDHTKSPTANIFLSSSMINVGILKNINENINTAFILELYNKYIGDIQEDTTEYTCTKNLYDWLIVMKPILLYYKNLTDLLDL